MRMVDIIHKKREGGTLTQEELDWLAAGAGDGSIPDYQLSALLMAIFFQGMSREETVGLTLSMARSGDMADLSPIPGVKVDKHSTGGVGDKTSLICGPMAAACGVKIAKMSGRGLGHTGGTVDKLESIPGLSMNIPRERFFQIVRETGIAIVGQSGSLCPADKKLYALRDVTAAVDSMPLIAASIMSKKLASGADAILLDVKTGSGALLKSPEEAQTLARLMVDTGNGAGRRTAALITDMEAPLGRCIGNALEVREAVDVLSGRGEERLTALCEELAAGMVRLAGLAENQQQALDMVRESVHSGAALAALKGMVCAQGGDAACLEDTSKLAVSPVCVEAAIPESGYISGLNAELCGRAAMELGAGRERKEDSIDYGAGIVLLKTRGEPVRQGEPFARLYAQTEAQCRRAQEQLLAALDITKERPPERPLILARIGLD